MPKVFHRDFLGAHRYTTRGGMCVLRSFWHSLSLRKATVEDKSRHRVLRNDRKELIYCLQNI